MMMKSAQIPDNAIALLAMPLAQASCASDNPAVVAKAFWLLSDLISPNADSLLSHLEQWHQEFGKGR